MKIIIVGGGIGGLAAYHALRKYLPAAKTSVIVYETYPTSRFTTTVIGGGLGLQPNGQRAAATISPTALEYIQARGMESPTFTIRNQEGKVLGVMNVGNKAKHGYGSIMAPRAVVHEAFLVEGDVEKEVKWGKKVKEVKEFEDRVEVLFEDGDKDTCDLLIGADGVRSICKEALFPNQYPPNYDGLTGIGGFLPLSALSPTLQAGIRKEIVTMTFSRSGFFGYAFCSPSSTNGEERMMWWSTYECNPPLPRDTPPSQVLDHLVARHGDWISPYDEKDTGRRVFKDIVTLGCQDGTEFLVLPRYITPLLPNWSTVRTSNGQGRIVLLGDAAHTMPPDSGQGVSCAIEDGLALALLLRHYLSNSQLTEVKAIQKSLLAYEEIRKPRVATILKFAKRGGDSKRELGWFGEKMRDWAFWFFLKLPFSVIDGMHSYDVEAEVKKYLKDH
ncbi:hypothetical protein E1B28_012916 [Marasmius oreades]|uniref:FAD-binding domain-containing protein n=1 Tax=Marasmius oreades TaxID=181124 RepID=A0A9P7UPG3_9AGAR|nr:uncharacterized protein E1B28_012916 [Marasmius oreades]KAG7088970.1 hypothetical protein E1B28_012916 [Marasmius oreades]